MRGRQIGGAHVLLLDGQSLACMLFGVVIADPSEVSNILDIRKRATTCFMLLLSNPVKTLVKRREMKEGCPVASNPAGEKRMDGTVMQDDVSNDDLSFGLELVDQLESFVKDHKPLSDRRAVCTLAVAWMLKGADTQDEVADHLLECLG